MKAIMFGFKELDVRPSGIRIKEVTANGEPTGIIIYVYDTRSDIHVIRDNGHALHNEYVSIDEFSADLRDNFGRSSKRWWHRNPLSPGVRHRDTVQSYAREV